MVTAYPIARKQKSADICRAFIEGCGGAVAVGSPSLLPGPAFFFGIDASNEHLWQEARADLGREWFYCDNSYFDQTRGTHFRVAKNRLQHTGNGTSDGARFRALGVQIRPWLDSGDHVLVCPQSEHFMRVVAGFKTDWLSGILPTVKSCTTKPVKVRDWQRDKGKAAATLGADLERAAALVTWSSAAAVMAVLAGVPVCVGGDCAAAPMSGPLHDLDNLPRPERANWAGVLADAQWTLDEFRDGTAWRVLQGEPERMAA